MGNALLSLLITNLLFTSTLNLYSIKGKLDGLKPLLTLLFKSASSLVLLLWFLTLYLGVLQFTPLAAPPLLLLHPLQPWTPFWWKSLFWCAALQLSLTLTTLKCAVLPNQLGFLTPIFYLFTSSLLPYWPDKSIRMHLCN